MGGSGPRRNGMSGTGSSAHGGLKPKMILMMVPNMVLKMPDGWGETGLLQRRNLVVVSGNGDNGRTKGGPTNTIPRSSGSNKNGGRNNANHNGPMIDPQNPVDSTSRVDMKWRVASSRTFEE